MSDWLAARFSENRPRAVAALTRYFRDIDLAEEAFSEACVKALTHWPQAGLPRDPLAWLLTAARNAGLDRLRKEQRRRALLAMYHEAPEPVEEENPDPDALRDDVLRLLFICCHPALTRQDQIALALRIVGGLTVDEIARSFLARPKTMEQRLTRARRKAAATPVAFETPSPQERARRLGEVSLMVYLMFNEGWSTSGGDVQIRLPLCEEAIRLSRLLAGDFPAMGEQSALLALLLFQHARRGARVGPDGALVPLDDQDRSLWDRANIREATALLQKAQRSGHHGVYLVQAAIASVHARATSAAETDWPQIESHYEALHALQPTPVVRLNLIAAQARTRGAAFALDAMEPLRDALADYRWFHAMRGELLQETGAHGAALSAFDTALKLGPTEPERAAVQEKIALSRTLVQKNPEALSGRAGLARPVIGPATGPPTGKEAP